VLGQTTSNTNSLDSPRPGLGGSRHLPPYGNLCVAPPHPHLNEWLLVPGLPRRSRETVPDWTPETLGAHNSQFKPLIGMRSEANL